MAPGYVSLYISLILILYIKTWKYYQLIDDPVPRSGVLRELPRKVHYSFYDTRRPIMATITNIGVFIFSCLAIDMNFGWKVALLYAVMPTNVSSVAWTTGNYYQTTVLFIMTALYFAKTQFWWLSPIFYHFALQSTPTAIPYAFIIPFIQAEMPLESTIVHLAVLGLFLTGKRFRGGLKLRKEKHDQMGAEACIFRLSNLFIVVKVIGYYIYLNLFPARLGLFHDYGQVEGKEGRLARPTKWLWLNLLLIIVFAKFSWEANSLACIWWFLFIGLWSQFITVGQFIAERYMYLANVGFCLVIYSFLEILQLSDILYTVIVVIWFCRSYIYVPVWRHNRDLFASGIVNFPKTPHNYTNISSYYNERNRFQEAIPPALCALELAEGNKWMIHSSLSNAYAHLGYYEKALWHTQEALKTCDKDKFADLTFRKMDLDTRIRQEKNRRRRK